MIKKVCVLVLLLCVCFGGVGFANDAGILSDNENLYIKLVPKSSSISIGETAEFTIKVTNKTGFDAIIEDVVTIFKDHYAYEKSCFNPSLNLTVPAYGTIEFDYSCIVPPNVDWYKDGNSFYIDTDLVLQYCSSMENIEEDEEDDYIEAWYWQHHPFQNTKLKPITLKIDNLNDGYKMLDIDINSDVGINYYWYTSLNNSEYRDLYSSSIIAKNLCDFPLTIISANGSFFDGEYNDTLIIDENSTAEISSTPYIPIYSKSVPAEITVNNKVVFIYKDNYYGVFLQKTLPAIISDFDSLRVTIVPVDENDVKSQNDYIDVNLTIKNISSRNLLNVVFNLDSYYDSVKITIPDFQSWDTRELTIKLEKTSDSRTVYSYKYVCGWQINNEIYSWYVSAYHKNYYFSSDTSRAYGEFWGTTSLPQSPISTICITTPTPTNTPYVLPPVKPTITTSLIPTPTKEVTTPTTTPKPLTPTPQTIVIENVKVKGYFSIWVWIALGISSILVITLIIIMRKKEEKEN